MQPSAEICQKMKNSAALFLEIFCTEPRVPCSGPELIGNQENSR